MSLRGKPRQKVERGYCIEIRSVTLGFKLIFNLITWFWVNIRTRFQEKEKLNAETANPIHFPGELN